MGVDFVGSDGAGQGDGKNRLPYDIEYTTPTADSGSNQPKTKPSFFDRFRKSTSAQKVAKQTVVQGDKVPVNAPTVSGAPVLATPPVTSAPADKAYAIVEHQETTPVKSVAYQPITSPATPQTAATAAESASPTTQLGKKVRIIPPPPPPPVHTHETVKKSKVTPPVAPVAAAQHPVVPESPLPPSKPSVKPSPMSMPTTSSMRPPTQPVLTGAPVTGAPTLTPTVPPKITPTPVVTPSAPSGSNLVSGAPRKSTTSHATVQDTNGNSPVIIAQNVSSLKGEMTQPQASISSGLSVNLLSQYAANGMNGETGILRLVRIFTVTLWFFSVAYAAMIGYQAYAIFRNEQIQSQLIQLNTEIESYHTLQVALTNTNATLTALQELLNQHIYWTNWFAFLEKYTLPNVYYTEFSGSSTGSMSLAAVTNDYEAITQQINAFNSSDVVESVEVNTATRTNARTTEVDATSDTTVDTAVTTDETATAPSGLIHFTLTVVVKPELFYYQPGQYDGAYSAN